MSEEPLTREEIRDWRSRNIGRRLKWSLLAIPGGVAIAIGIKLLEAVGISWGVPANVMHAAVGPVFLVLTISAVNWLIFRKQDSHEILHERLLRQRIDREQAKSRFWLIGFVALGFWFAFDMTPHLEKFVGDPGKDSTPFMYAVIMAQMAIMACHGPGYQSPAIRKGLNDELTMNLRRKSVVAGYVCVMLLLCAAFALIQFRPDLTMTLFLWLIFAGASTPLISFVFLDWRASRGG